MASETEIDLFDHRQTLQEVAREAILAYLRHFAVDEVAWVPGFEWSGVPVFLEYGPEQLDVRISERLGGVS